VTKPFKPRRYVPGEPWPEDRRSPAQKAAHRRSFQIFQLRGLHALAYRMTEPRRSAVQTIIDDEIASLGAETQSMRNARQRFASALDGLVEALTAITDDNSTEISF
jgi:hypothetical protein